jgi:hypothetical protein
LPISSRPYHYLTQSASSGLRQSGLLRDHLSSPAVECDHGFLKPQVARLHPAVVGGQPGMVGGGMDGLATGGIGVRRLLQREMRRRGGILAAKELMRP